MKSSKTCVAKSTPSLILSVILPAPRATSSVVIPNEVRDPRFCNSSTIKPSGRHFMKSALTVLVLFILATASFAQEHPALTALPNSVYVGADGKFESAPDTAVIQFNISVQETTSQAAYDHASKEAEQVRQVLHANGIEPKSATVGFFSVQPMYEWKPKQKVIGYRVTTDVTLKLKDFSKIGAITQQLADANVSERQTLN